MDERALKNYRMTWKGREDRESNAGLKISERNVITVLKVRIST